MMAQWCQEFFWNICMQHLCWISHIALFSSPGLHNHCESSHKSASGGRARQFQRGLARLEDRVQVRQATLQLVEGGCGLTRLSYGAQQLPWPQLCSCGWTSNLCPSGVKNYEIFARVIVLSLSIVDGFLQRACLRWLASCFLVPWSQRSSRSCAWRWPSLGLRGASRGCEPIPRDARENMTLDEDVRLKNNAHRCILDPVCVCVCVLSIMPLVLYHIICIHKEIDTNEVTDNIMRKRETKRRRV
jgi:hypothetical protein